jgi:Cellulase (glycosyl hydrolase family 5)
MTSAEFDGGAMRASKNLWNLPVAAAIALGAASLTTAADLPTAKSIAAEMGVGWNIGNSMEVPGNPTNWGNPIPTQRVIDSVKAAGFKTVRIPCAWDSYADATTHVIKPEWMAQVKQVVDFCIKDSLFVVLNIHWDGGWIEGKIDSAATRPAMLATMKAKQGAYWKQIATTFKDYDRHLLFASANEPGVDDQANLGILMSLHQIFVDTVRATGGKNASRSLILQGPSTSFEHSADWITNLPTDKIADRFMVEAHFYPYQYCLMSQPANWGTMAYPFYYWGKGLHSTTDLIHNPGWGEESYVDSQFNLMKPKFLNKNIPVLVGEFGAMKRMTLTGDSLRLSILGRRRFYNYVVGAALSRGMIPVLWDAGGKGDGTMSVFDRTKDGAVYDLGLLNAVRTAAGLSRLPGDTSEWILPTGNNSMKILYSAKDSLFGQVKFDVPKPNFGAYDSILVRAYVNGQSKYDSAGISKYGYLGLNLVTMSNNWAWREATLGTLTNDAWATYSIPLSSKQADTAVKGILVPADPTKIDFFALQATSKGYNGTIYVDWIVFKTKAGVSDTVYPFNVTVPSAFSGNVVSVTSIATSAVASDVEWKTATTGYKATTAIAKFARIQTGLRHTGTRLVSSDKSVIRLTDLRGQLVRTSTGSLELSGLPQGIYLATDGVSTLHVPLAQ